MQETFTSINAEFKKSVKRLIETVEITDAIPMELYNKYNVKRGLRNSDGTGVLVGLTAIGEVHGYVIEDSDKIPAHGKLLYRGISINKLIEGSQKEQRFGFEEVCYLILFGELPNKEHLETFKKLLTKMRKLPDNFVEDTIIKTPSKNIMNKLARSVLTLYSYDEKADDISLSNVMLQSISLVAKFPILIANAYATKKYAYEGGSLVIHTPNPELSTAENFLYMIRPDHKYTKEEAEILDLCLIVHAEHGGGNNSAFTTHVVSSSDTDTYAAISSAICSLKGPKHGGAAETVAAMFAEIKENVKNWDNEDEVEAYVTKIIRKQAFDKKGLVYGMGHAIYTLSDPRSVLLKEKARELAVLKGREKEFALYELVEKVTPRVFFNEKHHSKPLCANVDFYSGFVYSMLGISHDLYTPLFSMSRIVGWCAHRIEEIVSGGRIIRPAYKSISNKLTYIPLEERQ